MQSHIALRQLSGWISGPIGVQAAIQVWFSEEQVAAIIEHRLHDTLIVDANSEDTTDRNRILTIRRFFGQQDNKLLFPNWSEAHKFKAAFEREIAKLEARLVKLIPRPEAKEPEPIEPPELPLSARFRGHWVIGTQGTGKTQLFQYMLCRDLDLVAQGKASVIVLDPTGAEPGQLIHNLISVKRFAPGGDLYGKLIIIDPTDRGYTTPINLFSLRADADDEDAYASAVDSYLSIMGGLMGQPLTSFQEPVLRHAVQAVMALPQPTLAALREVIRPRSELYKDALPKLDPAVREYFEHAYSSEGANRSRGEILNRLYALTSDPKFRRLFGYEETKIDFYEEMQGKVIVINAARDYLQSLTALYGRFFIALITAAGKRRARVPRPQRLPCFIYIDECNEFIADDQNAATILTKLRQMNIGLIFGNQLVSDIDAKVQEALLTAGIKYANCNQASARVLAGDMNCDDPSFLVNRPPLNFAAYIAGVSRAPFAIRVPAGVIESQPSMSELELEQVRTEIRQRYCVPAARQAYDQRATVHRDAGELPQEPFIRRGLRADSAKEVLRRRRRYGEDDG